MTRDAMLIHLIGIEAQLRGLERMVAKIGCSQDLQARVPPVLRELGHSVSSLTDRIKQGTEWR